MCIIEIDHLETMRRLLPLTKVYVDPDGKEMRYKFRKEGTAKYFEATANRLIIANHLPLVADVAVWSIGGYVFETNLIIRYAPEFEDHPCY